jgi:NAD-dependent DNA ligase
MNAKLLEERTVFHIGTPARVERVRFAPDFHMTPDADFRWVHQLQPEGIEKYLGSGMVKGIGPVYAKKLVAKFGEQIFEVIETASARLEELDGIGPKRRKRIKDAWAEQKVIRQIMVFLHSNGVSTSRAVRIYKTYGENESLQNNRTGGGANSGATCRCGGGCQTDQIFNGKRGV